MIKWTIFNIIRGAITVAIIIGAIYFMNKCEWETISCVIAGVVALAVIVNIYGDGAANPHAGAFWYVSIYNTDLATGRIIAELETQRKKSRK